MDNSWPEPAVQPAPEGERLPKARTVRARGFEELIKGPEGDLDLAQAALLIARDAYPLLSVGAYLGRLDELSHDARKQLGRPRRNRTVVERLNRFLFADLGFRGNTEDYYDPRNSYLNEVLDRRVGIPITLSVIYMEVGRRLGYQIDGVGLPGHFIVRLAGRDELFIDPFNRGDILDREDCVEKVRRLFGTPVEDSPELLAVATKAQIITRMLNNLKAIYLRQELFERALPVVDKILLLDPDNPQERRDRALVLLRLKRYPEARTQLAAFLDVCPKEEENQEMINEATQLLGWLSQLN